MNQRAQQLVEELNLQPHPEGGFYREVFRSSTTVFSPVAQAERSAVTKIYFLLVKGQVSHFHKVLHDEIWHFYEGDPLLLLVFDLKQTTVSRTELGHRTPLPKYTETVLAGAYQAAETLGEYSLVGCTVAPGFEFSDFSFLADNPQAAALFRKQHQTLVKYL